MIPPEHSGRLTSIKFCGTVRIHRRDVDALDVPIEEEWVRSLIDRGRQAGMAVFVKQLGALWARGHGLRGRGGDPTQWPEDLRVREYPEQAQECR